MASDTFSLTRAAVHHESQRRLAFIEWPVSQPRTSLLVFDWEWFGLIDPFEVPGPLDTLGTARHVC